LNKHILNTEVQEYIQQHLHLDPAQLALKKSPFKEVSSQEIAEQLAGKKSAEKKIPEWHTSSGIYFPPKLALEQASSAQTAIYKSKLIEAKKIIDLSAGMGVDSYYFSKKADWVWHVERQAELSAIAAHNSQVLGAKNIYFITGDGVDYLRETQDKWDCIYIDPSRRVAGKKVFKLSDCEPDVPALLDLFFEHAAFVMIKTAPLLDITSGLSELRDVTDIHVVSVNNEVKELLWILRKESSGAQPNIHCVSLTSQGEQHFSFKISEEKALQLPCYSDVKTYLYEPDTAWLKAACFKLITDRYQVDKINQHTHLYTSVVLKKDFPGRIFNVEQVISYKEFAQSKEKRQANILVRNFPITAPELQKKHQIKDGGEQYLIFCKDQNEDLKVVIAKRI